MGWLLKIQALGSLFVLGAFASSELSAQLLDWFPGSPLAWYLCVGVFRPFETARSGTSALRFLFEPSSLAVACGLILLTVLAYLGRRRLMLAAIANVCFVSTMFLAHTWFRGLPMVRSASVNAAMAYPPADSLIVAAMLVVSLAAALLGHAMLLGPWWPARPAVTVALHGR